MNRPCCPHCNRPVTTIGTRPAGADRVRYLGCRKCQIRAGVEIIAASQTGHRGSNYVRNQSGQFAPAR